MDGIKNWKYFISNPLRKPTHLVLLLHGCGGNCNDGITFSNFLKTELRGFNFVAVSPEAPISSVEGVDCYQWFDIERHYSRQMFEKPVKELNESEKLDFQAMLSGDSGLFRISESLNDFLDRCQEMFNIGDGNTIIAGYSQGAMVAIDMGLNRKNPVSRVISVSGCIIPPCYEEIDRLLSRPHVTLIHGMDDNTIDFNAGRRTRVLLEQRGVETEFIPLDGLSHGMGEEAPQFWSLVLQHMTRTIRLADRAMALEQTAPGIGGTVEKTTATITKTIEGEKENDAGRTL